MPHPHSPAGADICPIGDGWGPLALFVPTARLSRLGTPTGLYSHFSQRTGTSPFAFLTSPFTLIDGGSEGPSLETQLI